jgi:hypothetical protein
MNERCHCWEGFIFYTVSVTHSKGIQDPTASNPHQTKNAAEIVRKDDASKPSAIAQPSDLEYLFVLRLQSLGTQFGRIAPCSPFVDLKDRFSNVLDFFFSL